MKRTTPIASAVFLLLFASLGWSEETTDESIAPTQIERDSSSETPVEKKAAQSDDPAANLGPGVSAGNANDAIVPDGDFVLIFASVYFRMLAVSDPDPANDRSLVYGVSARVSLPVPGLSLGTQTSLTESFVAEPGDSAFRLGDSALDVGYQHQHLDDDLILSHRLKAWLPTSRRSLQRELYVAPTFTSLATYRLYDPVTVGYGLEGQYRWYRYAEVPNRLAMNTQIVLGNRLNAAVTLFKSETFGRAAFSASSGLRWFKKYASTDHHESATADAALWNQSLTWSAALTYTPIRYLTVSIGADHGTSFRRNGIVNPFVVHRDSTELSLGLVGNY